MHLAMTEALFYQTLLEFSKAILNAETEEEVEAIREGIPQILKEEWNYDDIAVEQYMTRLDRWIERFENDESLIAEVEREVESMVAQYYPSDVVQEVIDSTILELTGNVEVETGHIESSNTIPTSVMVSGGIGIALAALVGYVAFRKNAKKKDKNKSLKR